MQAHTSKGCLGRSSGGTCYKVRVVWPTNTPKLGRSIPHKRTAAAASTPAVEATRQLLQINVSLQQFLDQQQVETDD
jgi:hypothetical protein